MRIQICNTEKKLEFRLFAISQRLARIDTKLVELSGLKFFGKTEGANTVAKAKHWISKNLLSERRDFKAGTFLRQYGSNVKVDSVKTIQEPN